MSDWWGNDIKYGGLFSNGDGFKLAEVSTPDPPELIIKLIGWVVMDDSGSLWFFPGMNNKPEKKDGEWIGFSPISLVELEGPIPENIKETPKIIIFKSCLN